MQQHILSFEATGGKGECQSERPMAFVGAREAEASNTFLQCEQCSKLFDASDAQLLLSHVWWLGMSALRSGVQALPSVANWQGGIFQCPVFFALECSGSGCLCGGERRPTT